MWEAEGKIALNTFEDKKWEKLLKLMVQDLSFFKLYDCTPSMSKLNIEVRSLYYIQSLENGITVSVFRYLRDRKEKPFRSFMLGEYAIPFSKALAINEGKLNLSDSIIDENNRKLFIDRYHELLKQNKDMYLSPCPAGTMYLSPCPVV